MKYRLALMFFGLTMMVTAIMALMFKFHGFTWGFSEFCCYLVVIALGLILENFFERENQVELTPELMERVRDRIKNDEIVE